MKTKILGCYNDENFSCAIENATDLKRLVNSIHSQAEKPKIKEINGQTLLYTGSGKKADIRQAMVKEWGTEHTDEIFCADLRVFVVHATCGRMNGYIFTLAENISEARKTGRTCGWLDNGRVSSVQTFEDYLGDMGETEEEQESYTNQLSKRGDWVEIDWGC